MRSQKQDQKPQQSRKALFATWSQERIDAFLKAERGGYIEEVSNGWMFEGHFYQKMPFKGEVLTSYLEFLAARSEEDAKRPVCSCGHAFTEHKNGSVVGLGLACTVPLPEAQRGDDLPASEEYVRCMCDDYTPGKGYYLGGF